MRVPDDAYDRAVQAFEREVRIEAGIETAVEAVVGSVELALLRYAPTLADCERFRQALGFDSMELAERAIRIALHIAVEGLGSSGATPPPAGYRGNKHLETGSMLP